MFIIRPTNAWYKSRKIYVDEKTDGKEEEKNI